MIMRLTRFILLFPVLVLLATCSSSNIPQKLDSFVDNAELLTLDALYERFDYQVDNKCTYSSKTYIYEEFIQGNSACLIVQNNVGVSQLLLQQTLKVKEH